MLQQDIKYPVYCVKIKFPICKNICSQGRVDTRLNTLFDKYPITCNRSDEKDAKTREYSPPILSGVYKAK